MICWWFNVLNWNWSWVFNQNAWKYNKIERKLKLKSHVDLTNRCFFFGGVIPSSLSSVNELVLRHDAGRRLFCIEKTTMKVGVSLDHLWHCFRVKRRILHAQRPKTISCTEKHVVKRIVKQKQKKSNKFSFLKR